MKKKVSTSNVISVDVAFITKQLNEVVRPKLLDLLAISSDTNKLHLELRIDILPRDKPKAKFKQSFSEKASLPNLFDDIEKRYSVVLEDVQVIFGHGSDGCSLEFEATLKERIPKGIALTSCFF